jgi:hypothetical protein
MLNNGKLIFSICVIISLLIVYRICFFRNHKWTLSDIVYTGHVFVLAVLLFAAYCTAYFVIVFQPVHTAFKQSLWHENERRSEVVDDLIHNGLLKEQSSGYVISLLGKPMRAYAGNEILTYAYYTGFRKKVFAIDPEFLMIEFRKDHVQRCYLQEGLPYNDNTGDSLFSAKRINLK